jgi:Family of unknown function (DUF6188)
MQIDAQPDFIGDDRLQPRDSSSGGSRERPRPNLSPLAFMYKIDISTDFSTLIGNELIQVCIAHQVVLYFTNELVVSIYCPIRVSQNGNTLFSGSGEDPTISKDLVCLLDKVIESIEAVGENELVMHFSGQYSLALIDDSECYESFMITGRKFKLIC